MPSSTDLLHAAVVAVGLVCYAVLTALGHDGTPVLTAALAYGGGVVASKATDPPTTPPRPPAPPA